ncbi:DUF4333 domain-containing protein [Gordonia sp. L191]|uniref:DUF4333 domain-containing protein n=1 Tax=Gordonia sp. L191 TaxID=2982699 RepID=UPI0024BF6040|nr:DUF4333 domain-containing protein [Gordonia sp. L191]WHU49467.1 DUF4333 domain-containing protein [Gordonia sp. L191]
MSNPEDPSNKVPGTPAGGDAAPGGPAAPANPTEAGTDGKTEVVQIPGHVQQPPQAPPTTATPAGYPAQPGPPQQPGYPAPGYGTPSAPSGFGATSGQQYNPTQMAPTSQPQQFGQTPQFTQGQAYGPPQQFGQPQPYGQQPGQASAPYGAEAQAPYGGPAQQPGAPYGQQPGTTPYGAQSQPGTAGFGQFNQPQPGQPGPYGAYGAPGDQFAGMAAPTQKKGLWRGLIAVGAVLIVAAIAIVVTGWLWWWPRELDQTAAQNGVKQVLTEQYQASDVSDVSCPSGQKVKKGNSFTCTATVGGQKQNVKVTFLDDDGKYQVARPTS